MLVAMMRSVGFRDRSMWVLVNRMCGELLSDDGMRNKEQMVLR